MSQQGAVKTTAAVAGDLAQVVAIRDPITAVVTPEVSSTGTLTRVPANVAAVTILAANAGRIGGSVWNQTATANLFLSLSATAPVITPGAERYSVKLVPGAYFEIPFGYDGIIQGIWDAADATGYAAVDEYTA